MRSSRFRIHLMNGKSSKTLKAAPFWSFHFPLFFLQFCSFRLSPSSSPRSPNPRMLCTAAAPCSGVRSAIRQTSPTGGTTMAGDWKTASGASRRGATSSSRPWIGSWTQGALSALRKTLSRERCSDPTTPPSILSVSVWFQPPKPCWVKIASWQDFLMATRVCVRFLHQKRKTKVSV